MWHVFHQFNINYGQLWQEFDRKIGKIRENFKFFERRFSEGNFDQIRMNYTPNYLEFLYY